MLSEFLLTALLFISMNEQEFDLKYLKSVFKMFLKCHEDVEGILWEVQQMVVVVVFIFFKQSTNEILTFVEMMLLCDLKFFLIGTKYNCPSRTQCHIFLNKFFSSFYENHKEPEINCALYYGKIFILCRINMIWIGNKKFFIIILHADFACNNFMIFKYSKSFNFRIPKPDFYVHIIIHSIYQIKFIFISNLSSKFLSFFDF